MKNLLEIFGMAIGVLLVIVINLGILALTVFVVVEILKATGVVH